ncbi:MAG: ABC transporter ATP-binding protein [SAR324 cluster bacterium]|nr:ABC transporter ATP-binding protein [SAR324 cluster bacterium]
MKSSNPSSSATIPGVAEDIPAKSSANNSGRLKLLWHYVSQHKLTYGVGIFSILATNWIAVSIPQYIQKSIDLIQTNLAGRQDELLRYLVIMLSLALGMVVVRTLSRVLFFNPGRAVEFAIKNDLFSHLTRLQKNYYDHTSTGAIISRVNNDITGIRLICGFGLLQLFNIISALSMTPWKMWLISPDLTLYCVIPVILVFSIVRFGMKFIIQNMNQYMDSLQKMSGFTVAALSGIDVIKSYGMNQWTVSRFQKDNQSLLDRSLIITWIRSFTMPILVNLDNFLKIVILALGGAMMIEEGLTIGQLTAFITYAGLLTMPLMGLGWVTTIFQQGFVGLNSIQTIFQEPVPFQECQPLPEAEAETLMNQGVVVKNLSFRYSDQEDWVLKNISFQIQPGQTVGILGKVSSGKTTLVHCLSRYLETSDGTIYFGKHDINHLTYEDIRKSIHTVPQEPFLFSDTVQENILFPLRVRPENPDELLKRLLFECALDQEVQHFSNNVHTIVGEKGIMLSGGQKQRISLARALASPCELLILDNVLSAVDYETEHFLLDQIFTTRRAKSLLIVSHRCSALEKADHILVLDEGRIVDQGTHEDLVTRPGHYQETWNLQHQTEG